MLSVEDDENWVLLICNVIDLVILLECINKNFVIIDFWLLDNFIVSELFDGFYINIYIFFVIFFNEYYLLLNIGGLLYIGK